MKNDLLLSDLSSPFRNDPLKGGKSILSYLGIVCAAATVVVFSALFFADISLSAAATLGLGMDFALLFFSSYVMYSSLFETGKSKAEEREDYQCLLKKRAALFERYRTEGSCASLTRFCKQTSEKETASRREITLLSHFLEPEDYEALLRKAKEELSYREKRLLKRISRASFVHITPRLLLADGTEDKNDRPFAHSPAQMRRKRLLRFLLPSLFTAFFSVSIVCQVIESPTPDIVVGYLLKLFTLFLNGIKGFRAGFFHVTEEKTRFLTEQCFWFEEYFASSESEKIPPRKE